MAESLEARLPEVLLRRTEWSTLAEIAAAAEVTPGGFHEWGRALLHFGVLHQTADGLRVSPEDLWRYFAARRMSALKPQRGRSVQGTVADIHSRLTAADIPHVFGFFTAANQWAFYEHRRTIQVYLEPRSTTGFQAALAARMHLDDPTVWVEPFEERLSTIPAIERDELPVTDPIRTVLDLRTHPEGSAHAEFLLRHVVPRWVARPA